MSSQSETTLKHFSHPHPLKLTNHQNISASATCSGCKLQVNSGTNCYSCTKNCHYFLHTKCAKMPSKITHPFEKKGHVLTLYSKSPYEGSSHYNCDACGKPGQGFCYHCKICKNDLHILCAVLPLKFNHQSHPHQLNLIFSPTHYNKIFVCDVCGDSGSDHWLYRCNNSGCDFDVHLNCRNIPTPRLQNQAPTTSSRSLHHQPPQSYSSYHVPTGIPTTHPYQGMDNYYAVIMAEMMRLEQELLAVQHRMNQQQMQVFQQIQNMTAAQRYGNGGFGGIQNLIHGLTGGPTNMLGGNIPGLDPFSVLGGGGGFGGMDFTSFLGGGGFDIFGNLGIGSFLGGGFGFGFC